MACSITVDLNSAQAIQSTAGQPPDRIELSGTAAECAKISARLTFGGETIGPVQADVVNGDWTAIFQAPADFTQGDFPCDASDIKYHIECVDDSRCNEDGSIALLPCTPPRGDCPTEAELEIVNEAGDEFDPTQCVPPGDYTITVVAPTGSNIFYNWSLNNLAQAGASGPGQNTFDVSVPGNAMQMVSVAILLPDIPNCFLSGAVTLTPCEEPDEEPECSDSLEMEVTNADGARVDPDAPCLEPGRYTFRITSPSGSGVTYSWSVDGELQPGETDDIFDLELDAGETRVISAVAAVSGCPPLSNGVELTGCVRCPDEVDLQVLDERREPVDTGEDCLPAGRYTIRVVSPTGPGISYIWSVDGDPQSGATGSMFTIELNDGEHADVTVSVQAAGCPPLSAGVELEACRCPDPDLGIAVETVGGAPVDVSRCVSPGTFRFTAEGDVGDADLHWTADGQNIGNGTEATFTFNPASVSGTCGDVLPSSTISVTASSSDTNCPDAVSAVTLTLCRASRFCVDCWLIRLLIIFLATVSAIGAAVWMCPAVVVNPLIPQTAPLLAVAIAVAPWVAIVAGVLALALLLFWWWWCRPNWCNDWMVLLWQLLVSIGFVFMYFGNCPACAGILLPIGLLLLAAGVIVFVVWLIFCRPPLCKIFFEIGSLGLVQLVVGWLEFIIGACIWMWGWLLQLVFQMILNLVGWIGVTIACNLNPNR